MVAVVWLAGFHQRTNDEARSAIKKPQPKMGQSVNCANNG